MSVAKSSSGTQLKYGAIFWAQQTVGGWQINVPHIKGPSLPPSFGLSSGEKSHLWEWAPPQQPAIAPDRVTAKRRAANVERATPTMVSRIRETITRRTSYQCRDGLFA